MLNIIIGQAFGIMATILTFISYQANTKKALLIIQSIATLCTCLGFLFLGATTGFALNIICLTRNAIYYFQDASSKFHMVTSILLTLAMVCFGILSWQGWISLLVIIALSVNTMILSLGNPQILRISVLPTSTLMIIYNIFVFSLGGIANESISIISSVIGIIRYRKEKRSS